MFESRKKQRGVSLVEVIIGISMAVTVLVVLGVSFAYFLRLGLNIDEQIVAAYLLDEGIEAARFIRDTDWTTFAAYSSDTTYYVVENPVGWSLTTTVTPIDGQYYRTLTFTDVYRRNSDDDIIDVGEPDAKTLDPDIRRVEVEVAWSSYIGTSTATGYTYLANLFEE